MPDLGIQPHKAKCPYAHLSKTTVRSPYFLCATECVEKQWNQIVSLLILVNLEIVQIVLHPSRLKPGEPMVASVVYK
jgi:hypothetical protein